MPKKKAKTRASKPLRQPRLCKRCGRNTKRKYHQLCIYCEKEVKRQKKEDRKLQKALRASLKSRDNILEKLFNHT